MSIDEAAKALEVSDKTVRRHIRDGKLAARLVRGRHGREWDISEAEITRFRHGGQSVAIVTADQAESLDRVDASLDRFLQGQDRLLDLAQRQAEAIERLEERVARMEEAQRRPWWRRWR